MSDESALEKLPESWQWIDIKNNIYKIPLTGKKLKKGDCQETGHLPVVDQGQDFIGGYTDKIDLKISVDLPLVIFGDHTRCFKYVDFDFVPGADGVKVIRPISAFNPKLFFYFLHSIKIPNKGYARHFQYLEKSFIPLPPLNEQKRIVNKIEELFTKLDAGIQELTRAKEKLKVYRQSVLKHAFEGKLTEEWREARKDEIESASNFLKNIENERIKESKTKKKSAVPDTSELSKIPDEWEWTYLESIIFNHDKSRIPVKSADRKEMSGIYPYYGASGIIDYVDNYLFDGEYLLIGEDGANLLSRSKPIAFLAKGQFWVNNHAHVLQTRGNMPLSYLEHYINSIDLKLFVTGSAQPKLTQRSMNKIPIKIPPSDEQKIIAEEIDAKFSLIEDIEKNLNENLIKANNLRQSILKKAFTGQLVHQDPNDEPAEQLLERIKAQKEKQKPQRKSKQKRLVK